MSTALGVQYLEDNETLITSALQLLSQGRAAEATKLQTLLQRNLMWLASIADSQAQPPQPAPEASSQVCLQALMCQVCLISTVKRCVHTLVTAHSPACAESTQACRGHEASGPLLNPALQGLCMLSSG